MSVEDYVMHRKGSVLLWSEAGKTSTLSILTGAILPSAGKAFLGGFDVVQEQRQALEDFETDLNTFLSLKYEIIYPSD